MHALRHGAVAALVSALALLPPPAAHADSIGARVAVSQCYSACWNEYVKLDVAEREFFLDVHTTNRWRVTDAVVQVICWGAQGRARAMEGCAAGCGDIEAAYRYRAGMMRSRFRRELNAALRPVKASGLFQAWNRYPAAGSPAFETACARYIGATSAGKGFPEAVIVEARSKLGPGEIAAVREKMAVLEAEDRARED